MGIIAELSKRLGPFGCALLEIRVGTPEYDELTSLFDLSTLEVEELATYEDEMLNIRAHIYKRDEDIYDVNIVKKLDGILGAY